MDRKEFIDIGNYAASLWPKWSLTDEQRELWWHKLQRWSSHDAREAIASAYTAGRWKEPTLSEVLIALKALRRAEVASTGEAFDISPEYLEMVQREEAEEAALLAQWSDADLADAKAEILRREPWLKMFDTLLPTGPFFRHLIVERFVHQRAATYPNAHRHHKDPLGSPCYISRDDFWNARNP